MPVNKEIFIGIDIGTQGVRTVAINLEGELLAETSESFSWDDTLRQEQSANKWWLFTVNGLQILTNKLKNQLNSLHEIKAISVTSTSGTVIPLDNNHQPIYKAIMYSDVRSKNEAQYCKQVAERDPGQGYKEFNSSCGLPKILWFIKNYPEQIDNLHLWCHASDFIIGKLSGKWGTTDYTNALKTGYDLEINQWPDYLFNEIDLERSWFPTVVSSGTVIGSILPEISELVGLPSSIVVTTGMTDGCASQIASGAVDLGEWNTTIGTTLVIKGVAKKKTVDPLGRLYNHRHPNGFWMPGGASNIGADWVTKNFGNLDLDVLNKEAEKRIPTSFFSYPLQQVGERFPFLSDSAQGFQTEGLSPIEAFTASMEGVAYIERYAYEYIESLTGEPVKTVFAAGGASNSKIWLKIRSNVMNKTIVKMKYTSGAVGAAILSASQTTFSNLQEAGHQLTKLDHQVEPSHFSSQYNENYVKFIEILKSKGYLAKEV